MEEHTLKALIIEDLKIHPKSKMSEIHSRMDDIDKNYLQRVIGKMGRDREVKKDGSKRNMLYSLPNKE